jgi:hypothetical protein
MLKTIERECEITDGRSVTVDVRIVYFEDRNYGADADGNRSTSKYFLSSYNYTAPAQCDDGEPLTDDDLEALEDSIYEIVENIDLADPSDFKDDADADYDYESDEELDDEDNEWLS